MRGKRDERGEGEGMRGWREGMRVRKDERKRKG